MLFKCHICGATVNTSDFNRVYVCSNCRKICALPDYCSEHVSFLYGRANHYLRTGKYDKALQFFQQIAGESPNDCHAFFSIAVSRYGVSYLDDAGSCTNEPRLHRVHSASILTDRDYMQAIALADDERRNLYIQEAKEIEAVRKEIVERAERAPSFDVFITCREHDAKNRRTPESDEAEKLYQYLTEEGFRVFYEKYSTAGEAGLNYDAFLYKALYTAKVMFVFGSKPEYFNDTSIRNEWSIFHERIKNHERKIIVNCVDTLSLEELPEELQKDILYQYTAISFVRESIELCQQAVGGVLYLKAGAVTGEDDVNKERQLSEIFERIGVGDFLSAESLCQTLLSSDPDNTQAFLGLLLCDMKVHSKKELADCREPFTKNRYYRKILFADPVLAKELQVYLDQINKRNIDAVYDRKYAYALELFHNGQMNKESLQKAKKAFELMSDYRCSRQFAKKCDTLIREIEEQEQLSEADELYETAVRFFEKAADVHRAHPVKHALDLLDRAESLYRSVRPNDLIADRLSACEKMREQYFLVWQEIENTEQEQHRRLEKRNKLIRYLTVAGVVLIVGIILTVVIFNAF